MADRKKVPTSYTNPIPPEKFPDNAGEYRGFARMIFFDSCTVFEIETRKDIFMMRLAEELSKSKEMREIFEAALHLSEMMDNPVARLIIGALGTLSEIDPAQLGQICPCPKCTAAREAAKQN